MVCIEEMIASKIMELTNMNSPPVDMIDYWDKGNSKIPSYSPKKEYDPFKFDEMKKPSVEYSVNFTDERKRNSVDSDIYKLISLGESYRMESRGNLKSNSMGYEGR